jgi:outer membrane protein OmpA-like peptidoglycan-associated protein
MQPIDGAAEVTLQNVFFDLNKSILRPESRIELDRLVYFLKSNPNLKIEIGGHTDSRGNSKENLTLSEDRAQSVVQYLIENGIDAKRLMAKGYGSNKPKFSDQDIANMPTEAKKEAAHQANRRTDYRVLSN